MSAIPPGHTPRYDVIDSLYRYHLGDSTWGNTMASAIEKWQSARIRHSHRHPPIININKAHDERLTFGQRAADSLASAMGSWVFISIQSVVLVIWIAVNVIGWIEHWDPYPFILLNLALSFQAAYAAPIIMMSQNRLAAKDRLMAEEDYRINSKAEEELKAVMRHLETQDDMMLDLLHRLEEQHQQIISRIPAAVPESDGTQA
jgi:uncharacterized membrane protein